MKPVTSKIFILIWIPFFLSTLLLPGASAAGADYPSKPITVIVPWAAGGINDLTWRALAEPMGRILGQPVIISNKPGGGGTVGAVLVKSAAPDGYTLCQIASSTHIMNAYLYDTGYELKDFTYICGTIIIPNCLLVKADSPWKNYSEFIQYARANPMKVRLGYYGPTGPGPIAMKWLGKRERLEFREVLYKGDAPGFTALLGNHIDAFCSATSLLTHVRSGQLRMLLAFTSAPIKGFDNVPTFRGLYGKIIESVMGLAGPKDLPPGVLAKLEDAVRKGMGDENFLKLVDSLSTSTVDMDHKEFTSFVMQDEKLVKEWLDELGMLKK